MSHSKHTVQVDGNKVDVDPDTTAKELKDQLGKPASSVGTYMDNGELVVVADHDPVSRIVPEGANLTFQPGNERFGHPV